MSRISKQLKEADDILQQIEIPKEDKVKLHEEQIAQLEKAIYRLWVDVEVAKAMINKGEAIGEEAYVTKGENNIQEAVAGMRGAIIQLEKQRAILKNLG